jgi:cell division protein FtsL
VTGSAARRGWSNQPVVREPDPQRARALWRVLGILAIALSPAVVCIVQQNECLRVLYRINTLRAEHDSLREEERRLRVDRARLESFARIEAWAVRERGLVRPDPARVIVLPLDPAASTPAPARGRGAEPSKSRLAGRVERAAN